MVVFWFGDVWVESHSVAKGPLQKQQVWVAICHGALWRLNLDLGSYNPSLNLFQETHPFAILSSSVSVKVLAWVLLLRAVSETDGQNICGLRFRVTNVEEVILRV